MIENDEHYVHTKQRQGQIIRVGAEAVYLYGILQIPPEAQGLVIMAHGIEENERDSRQHFVALAEAFNRHGLATLVADLFSSEEQQLDQQTGFFRHNRDIMQQRLIGAAEWFIKNPSTENLSIGYFGVDIVGSAVLSAAAMRPDLVAATAVLGGDMMLAREDIPRVQAPTLLLAAQQDSATVEAHQSLIALFQTDRQFEAVDGERLSLNEQHCFDAIARVTGGWFSRWLIPII